MSSRSLVHQLLFRALLDMRERGHASGDNAVYHLADLFHNAVLQMEEADENGPESLDEYDRILGFLRTRAKEKGCEEWLDQQLNTLEARTATEN
jgi:hypothetical protein